MKSWIKQKWVEALRSGQYRQVEGGLCGPVYHRNDEGLMECSTGYCCLGVLTDLYAKEHGLELRPSTDPNIRIMLPEERPLRNVTDGELLSTEVQRWAGLNDSNPNVEIEEEIEDWDTGQLTTTTSTYALSELNDNALSFEQIASLIEAQL